MKEVKGDIWSYADGWRVIPTNGIVNFAHRMDSVEGIQSKAYLVMGAGLAKQASEKYPDLDWYLGDKVIGLGNHVHLIHQFKMIGFPTKDHYKDKSTIDLVTRSTRELKEKAELIQGNIYIPRVGCGLGGLDWRKVKSVLENILEGDRFIVVNDK